MYIFVNYCKMYTITKHISTLFTPIEKTADIRISPPPIKPFFGSRLNKRHADSNFITPEAKKKRITVQ